jgi:hypothetical protein
MRGFDDCSLFAWAVVMRPACAPKREEDDRRSQSSSVGPRFAFGMVVRGVVRDMAMDQPFPALARFPETS